MRDTMIRRYDVLNGWKGVFAIFIIMLHFEGLFMQRQKYFETGYLTVDGFFMISGFLLGLSLLKNADKENNSLLLTWKKAKNIYPAYIYSMGLMLVLYICSPSVQARIPIAPDALVGELTMMQSSGIFRFMMINGVDWYVSSLIIASFLVLSLVNIFKSNYYRFIAPLLIILIYSWVMQKQGNLDIHGQMYGVLTGGVLRAFAALSIGLLIYKTLEHVQSKLINAKLVNFIEILMTIWLFSLLIAKQHGPSNFLILIPLSILIFCATLEVGIVSQVLKLKLFQFFGNLSLMLFLTHFFVINIFKIFFTNISDNLMLATLLFFLFEIPFAMFSNWFVSKVLTRDTWSTISTKAKRGYLQGKGIYIFALAGTTVLFLINGTDLWAEIVAEYLHYAEGKGLTGSLAGYLTIFPIGVGYFYHYVLEGSFITWFGFSAFVTWAYTYLCVYAIIKVLKRKVKDGMIATVLIVFFALLAHPSVSSLINITHLGYIPILLYIVVCIFDGTHLEEISTIPKITFIPLILSMMSKPSFSGFALILVLLFTKTYKKPITWIVLAGSAGLSLYQLMLYSHGAVTLKINAVTDFIKFIFIFIESVGGSILFAVTYYFEGEISRIVLVISFAIGLFVIYGILLMLWNDRTYKGLVGAALLGAVTATCVLPYILLDYSLPLSTLMQESGKTFLGKHKLQYQLTSAVVLVTLLLSILNYLFEKYKTSYTIRHGMAYLCALLAVNGMLSGIYSGQWQTVKEIKSDSIVYNNSANFIYPPLPDWDWSWSDSTTGWTKGNRYAKYLNKPNVLGEAFQNKNAEPMPQELQGAKIFLMYSDPFVGELSPTNYWELFKTGNTEGKFRIGDLLVNLDRATYNGIRYGVIDYSPKLAQRLFNETDKIKQEGKDEEVEANHLNFIITSN